MNDTEEDAKELIALAKPLCCHINLIPVNPIKERDFVQSDTGHIQAFKNKLESKKIHVTIRREMGRDIGRSLRTVKASSYTGDAEPGRTLTGGKLTCSRRFP